MRVCIVTPYDLSHEGGVNRHVRSDPEMVRREPYTSWLFAMKPEDGDYMRYPQGAEAKGWLASEHARLAAFVAGELGVAAADGGVRERNPLSTRARRASPTDSRRTRGWAS